MAHPHNSGSALRIFSKFCRMNGALGQFDFFILFFTVSLGIVEIEPGHCYYWILKQSGHDKDR